MPYMQRLVLGFAVGALLLGVPWPMGEWLPRRCLQVCAGALLPVAGCMLLAARRHGRPGSLAPVLGLLLGLGWSAWVHDSALAARLTGDSSGAVALTVRIAGAPEQPIAVPGQPRVVRFQARVLEQSAATRPDARHRRLRLTWYDPPPLAAGETWTLRAVLKQPWSYANPGGFDYERWLLGSAIHGTGWVRGGERLAGSAPAPLERLRRGLEAFLRDAKLEHAGVLLALLVGRTGAVPDDLWDILRVTGTVHLMVISGLHVSLAAALGFGAGRWLCRLLPPLLLWLDARAAGCLLGAMAAAAYVALAGAGLPALRALCMGAGVLFLLAGGRTGRTGSLCLLALALLLALDPLAVHQQGLWLSFGAVAILLLTLSQRHGRTGRVAELLRAQAALSAGMLPLVALLTGSLPVTGIPANLLAVPLMSLLVVPAALLGGLLLMVWPWAAGLLLQAADAVLGLVLAWLGWLAQAPSVSASGGAAALVTAQLAALWLLRGVPGRHLPVLLLCCLLPMAPRSTGVAPGSFRVMALDVGQGTAVLIDTRSHRLLYDAGPAFPSGFETGSAVVVPSIRATGPAALDALILSHDDLDHVGGAAYVRASLEPRRVLTAHASPGTEICHGRHWRWDGVTFRLLRVARPAAASSNDGSCILLVDNGRIAMLIAGDISIRVEAHLLRQLAAAAPPVVLMFAPHHGSGSSSSRALVRVVSPRLVFVSAGRGNRFGHPHARVLERYAAVGARDFQTGRDGALIWRSSAPDRVVLWRRERAPYWRAAPPAGSASKR